MANPSKRYPWYVATVINGVEHPMQAFKTLEKAEAFRAYATKNDPATLWLVRRVTTED